MSKPDRSTTRFALLGLLSLAPCSGYDLKKLSQESIAHFWSESYGQIYPTLRRLEAEGLTTRHTQRHPGRPDRQVCALTARGRQEMTRWLALPARSEPPRSELLLKLFFGGRVPASSSRRQVEAFRHLHQQLLERYRQVERSLRTHHARHPDLRWWLITLSFGRHRSRAFISWCDETLRQLARKPHKTRASSRSRKV